MSEQHSERRRPPSVIHCFRAAVGGVFRHVCDVAREQSKLGLKVGIICDDTTGGRQAEECFDELRPHCTLGIHRLPIHRSLHWSDLQTRRALSRICGELRPTIIHGHGAKGGAFARLVPASVGAKMVYTPHGGVLHYPTFSIAGRYYFALERYLARSTDGLTFVSEFGAETYARKIGPIKVPYEVIHNGLRDSEFEKVSRASHDHDFVFVGELRKLKGLNTLLEALSRDTLRTRARLVVFGDGPDAAFFRKRVKHLGLQSAVTMMPPAVSPAGRCLQTGSLRRHYPVAFRVAAIHRAGSGGCGHADNHDAGRGAFPEIFGPDTLTG